MILREHDYRLLLEALHPHLIQSHDSVSQQKMRSAFYADISTKTAISIFTSPIWANFMNSANYNFSRVRFILTAKHVVINWDSDIIRKAATAER